MAKSYKGITVDITFQGNTTKFNEAVSQVDQKLKTIDKDLTAVNRDLKLDPSNTTLVSQKFSLLSEKIKETKDRLTLMRDAQKEIEAAYSRGEIDKGTYRDFQRELGKTEASLKSLSAEAKKTTDALTQNLKSAVADLSSEFGSAASVIAKAETALVAFSVASSKVGANFDAAMSQVAATLQAEKGTEEYKKLEAAAKEMGETTSYTAAQAAMALQSLAQAGYTADESIERLPKTLTLAKAGGLDLASAAKIVTNSMAALQLSEDELDGLLDKMARTAQKSNTNISELGDAIRTVGGTMDMAGQSVDTMLTELGMLANAGISASEAGTHLRNIMLALTKTDIRKSLHDMGVEVLDSTGEIRDLTDIMTDLRDVTKSMGTGELTETFGNLFNVRDLSSINALLNGTKGSMQALREELENSEGAALQMSETMSDNLTGDVAILKSAFEGLQIAISDKLTPSLRKAAQEGTGFLGELTEQVKNGNLADDFERLGKSLKDLLSSGIETAARWLPTIIDLLTTVAEHFDDILATYLAMQAYAKTKTLVTAIGGIITSVVSLTAAIKAAESAQIGFNAAVAANALGLIATGLAAVVSGVTFALTKSAMAAKEDAEEIVVLSEETQRCVDATQALTEASASLREERRKSLENVSAEKSAISDLADSIIELSEQQNLSSGEYERLSQYIDKLNNSVPGLNLAFDKQTNSLNLTADAMRNMTESYSAYRQLQIEIDKNATFKSNRSTLWYKLKEVRDKQDKAQTAAVWEGASWDDWAALEDQAEALIKEIKALDEEIAASDENIKVLSDDAAQYSKILEELEEEKRKAAEKAEKEAKAAEELKNAYKDAKTAVSTYKNELKDLLGILDTVNKGTAYSTSQILDLIDKYPQLTSAIHATADGYIIEAEAVNKLTRAKADNLVASAKAQLAALEAQKSSLGNSLAANMARAGLNIIGSRIESQIDMYRQIADDISSGNIYSGSSLNSSSSGGSSAEDDWLKERKEAAKAEEAELENQYKTEKISAEEYYNGLMYIARKYYAGIGELREEYLSAENKVYEGLKKAQEDELSTAKKLEDQLRAVKEAEDALNRAQNQEVQVFSSAAGFHSESDTAAITKAQQTLADKNYNLTETLLKNARYSGESLSERLRNIGMADIRDLLPDLSGLRLPSLGGGTTTNNNTSTRNLTYNGGDINITIQGNVDPQTMPTLKTSIEDAVRAGINAFLDEENAAGQVGGI